MEGTWEGEQKGRRKDKEGQAGFPYLGCVARTSLSSANKLLAHFVGEQSFRELSKLAWTSPCYGMEPGGGQGGRGNGTP
jgi:hypothetical protein